MNSQIKGNIDRGMEKEFRASVPSWVHHPPSTCLDWKLSEPVVLRFIWRFHYEGMID